MHYSSNFKIYKKKSGYSLLFNASENTDVSASDCINLLKSTGHVMYQQFNIQQL